VSGPLSDPEFVAGLRPIANGLEGAPVPWPAVDVDGVTPDGSAIRVTLETAGDAVLLAFLATRCDGCETFWNALGPDGPLAGQGRLLVVVVTKGPEHADPAEVRRLAAPLRGVPVVMSDASWEAYRVTGYPFFVLVDPGARRVVRETVAFGMEDVEALVGTGGVEGGG
jgi:hypothetical protein